MRILRLLETRCALAATPEDWTQVNGKEFKVLCERSSARRAAQLAAFRCLPRPLLEHSPYPRRSLERRRKRV